MEDAERLARIAHDGQTDKAGAPYIEHPLRMASGLKESEEKIAALLHYTLEDTWVTREYLEQSGYSEHIIAAIEALTKLPDEEGSDAGYEKFIRRAGQNPLARTVKIADLQDNMNLARIVAPTEKDHARMEKYQGALEYLQALTPALSTQKTRDNIG